MRTRTPDVAGLADRACGADLAAICGATVSRQRATSRATSATTAAGESPASLPLIVVRIVIFSFSGTIGQSRLKQSIESPTQVRANSGETISAAIGFF
jgi:hypothetical protein